MLGPGVPVERYDGLASQVDLLPTLLDLIGLDSDHPMIGRDLLAMAPGVPGHAFMQYDATNAYRVGDRVVVHQPFSPPQQFRYRKGRLVPAALDPELARDALAHVVLPELLYREQRYHLRGEGPARRPAG